MASSPGYDGVSIEQSDMEDPSSSFWQVWIKRIVVSACIALVFEFVMHRAAPRLAARDDDDNDKIYVDRENSGAIQENKQTSSLVRYAELERRQTQDATSSDTKDVNNNENEDSQNDNVPPPPAAAAAAENIHAKVQDESDDDTPEAGPEIEAPADELTRTETEFSTKDLKKEEADKKRSKDAANERNNDEQEASQEVAQQKQVIFRNKSSHHPGMEGFHNWYDVETSLFRQYTVGRSDGVDALPPYVPKSRNGQVRVALRVTNDLTDSQIGQYIDVYWMNYKGHEESKGTIHRGETWTQTTWLEHPWVFRLSNTNELLLHYIPERVIPHLDEAPTVEDGNSMVGMQRIFIRRPTQQAERDYHICSIVDTIMPHPARHHFHNPDQAHTWTLLQMKRMNYFDSNPGATLLIKYLTNIAMHPDKPHYRQIRIANKKFYSSIWQTPARGLLLAAGFAEQHANAELGTDAPLPGNRVQDVSLVLFRLQQYLIQLEQEGSATAVSRQPAGADGSGRAGFGQAGSMNVRRS